MPARGIPAVAAERLFECSFLIPIRRDRLLSDGKLHRQDTWKWLEHALFVFGGATRAPELYEGWYLDLDSGQPVRYRSCKYIVALERSRLAEVRILLT